MKVGFFKATAMASITAVALSLAACSGEPEVAEPTEGVFAGLTISKARLVLPPVSGNPAAIYMEVDYSGDRGLAISGVQVSGAQGAMLHKTTRYNNKTTMAEVNPVAIRKGEKTVFEPGGLHIMAMGLDESVTAGSTVEVTLELAGGVTHKFEAEVLAAGDER
jgi:copper(I)-binding protein